MLWFRILCTLVFWKQELFCRRLTAGTFSYMSPVRTKACIEEGGEITSPYGPKVWNLPETTTVLLKI